MNYKFAMEGFEQNVLYRLESKYYSWMEEAKYKYPISQHVFKDFRNYYHVSEFKIISRNFNLAVLKNCLISFFAKGTIQENVLLLNAEEIMIHDYFLASVFKIDPKKFYIHRHLESYLQLLKCLVKKNTPEFDAKKNLIIINFILESLKNENPLLFKLEMEKKNILFSKFEVDYKLIIPKKKIKKISNSKCLSLLQFFENHLNINDSIYNFYKKLELKENFFYWISCKYGEFLLNFIKSKISNFEKILNFVDKAHFDEYLFRILHCLAYQENNLELLSQREFNSILQRMF